MNCARAHVLLGPYLDGELAGAEHDALKSHLAGCAVCTARLSELRAIAARFGQSRIEPPPELWNSIERRLAGTPQPPVSRFRRAPARWALAAALMLAATAVLTTFMWWGDGAATAEASAVDFGLLLDGLPIDPDAAFGQFLARYQGRPVKPHEAHASAAGLNFALPDQLPGGFQRTGVYLLRFGRAPGIAARYQRNGEFLCAIFHRPVAQEDYGTHQDHPCVIGKHRGHMVSVGAWKLVHLTDPSTCHCVLSRLDEERELPAVMAAVAPSAQHHQHHH